MSTPPNGVAGVAATPWATTLLAYERLGPLPRIGARLPTPLRPRPFPLRGRLPRCPGIVSNWIKPIIQQLDVPTIRYSNLLKRISYYHDSHPLLKGENDNRMQSINNDLTTLLDTGLKVQSLGCTGIQGTVQRRQ